MRLDELNGRKVMVAWSGGLDSTWTLWKVLTETDAEVHAHHIRIAGGSDARTEAEGMAVADLLDRRDNP